MIEKTVLDYLRAEMSVPVYMEMPRRPAGMFCVIEKTGSDVTNYIHTATIAVQSYAPDMLKAAEINDAVKRMMAQITTLPTIAGCRLNSDYNFTDTAMRIYRYQAVFEIIHYE